jgi:tetratricopeptide (TPR) repeat protein
MRKVLALSLVLAFFAAANAFAGAEARMTGKILDGTTKAPIEGASVLLETSGAKNIRQEVKSRPDGSYAVFVLDGTIRYKFTFSAEGYAPYEEMIKLKISDTTVKDIELFKGTLVSTPTGQVVAQTTADPAVETYNEGAALSNAGDIPGAIAKFEAAVAAKPDLMAGWIALAKMHLKSKNYPKAIEAAKKVLEIDDSDGDMWTILYQVYTATGDKANAAIAEKKMPANAGSLFNEAARKINAGDDATAEKLLTQAVEMDATFAQAYYELGMVFVRTGKTAEAKTALTKYIELDPAGKDAATAKEMLGYLK